MDFKTFFTGMDNPERVAFAKAAQTTLGYLHQVAHGKDMSLGAADVFVAVSGGKLTLADLPLSERAKKQDKIRRKHAPKPKTAKTA